MNLHETRKIVVKNYSGVFELVATMFLGETSWKTHIRFRSSNDFEIYIIRFDENGHESDDAIFTGYNHKLETPVFIFVNRSGFAKGTDFKRDNIKVIGDNCFIPSSKFCFIIS